MHTQTPRVDSRRIQWEIQTKKAHGRTRCLRKRDSTQSLQKGMISIVRVATHIYTTLQVSDSMHIHVAFLIDQLEPLLHPGILDMKICQFECPFLECANLEVGEFRALISLLRLSWQDEPTGLQLSRFFLFSHRYFGNHGFRLAVSPGPSLGIRTAKSS